MVTLGATSEPEVPGAMTMATVRGKHTASWGGRRAQGSRRCTAATQVHLGHWTVML
jgi:hypothetical protein